MERAARPVAVLPLLLGLGAWLVSIERMRGMDEGPGTNLGTLGAFTITWAAMMAAMMLPAIAPAIRAHLPALTGGGAKRVRGAARAMVLLAGYLLCWIAVGLAAYAMQDIVGDLHIGWLSWTRGGRYIASAVLLVAAAHQLTSLKGVCLRRCRCLRERQRAGTSGALWMGVELGAWCVGCCWALVCALFALGVMSIVWMAVVALLVTIERLLPRPRAASRSAAAVLATLSLGLATVPERLPGLVRPGPPPGNGTMMMAR